MASRQIIQPNEGLDIKCHATAHQLTIGDADSVSYATLDFYPGSIADFTDATVIGLHFTPGISNTRQVYVSKGGNDVTGDGSILNPFLTIGVAMSAIADASLTKKYDIMIAPGTYSENIILKPNVNLVSSNPLSVYLTGTIGVDISWADGQPNTALLMCMNIDAAATLLLDYETFGITQSIVAFQSCIISCPVDVYGHTANNITVFRGCVMLANCFLVSGFPQLTGCFSAGANIALQSAVARPMQCFLLAFNNFGQLFVTTPVGADVINVTMENAPMTAITLDGAGVSVSASSNSLPERSAISIVNGASLTRFNDVYGIKYTANAPGSWPVIPSTCQEGLDYLIDGQQSSTYVPVTSNLIGITSVDEIGAQYLYVGAGGIIVDYYIKATLPVIPSGICSLEMTIPIIKVASATRYQITGTCQISCNDGFDNLSISDQEFGSIQSIIGSNDKLLMRFSLGAGASSSSIVIMGQFAYRQ